MTERQMEDLIATYPSDFFPHRQLVFKNRQQSLADAGRYDLLFEDDFRTKIVMELKARPAKYEDASQLARYKDELNRRGELRVLMWLVAPLIPNAVRDFLDNIGIEYSEIHEAQFRLVAERHGIIIVEPPPPPPPPPPLGNILQAVLNAYNTIAQGDVPATLSKGSIHINPPNWPAEIYYSCWRRQGKRIAVRLKNKSTVRLGCLEHFDGNHVANGNGRLVYALPAGHANWTQKLKVDFPLPTSPEEIQNIAKAMGDLISLTRPDIEKELHLTPI